MGIVAGYLLILWMSFEMLFFPNAISVFHLTLGILQLLANLFNLHEARS